MKQRKLIGVLMKNKFLHLFINHPNQTIHFFIKQVFSFYISNKQINTQLFNLEKKAKHKLCLTLSPFQLFKQNEYNDRGFSGSKLASLPRNLHSLFHSTKSHIESSSTGSSFPAVFTKSVPFAAGSLKRS